MARGRRRLSGWDDGGEGGQIPDPDEPAEEGAADEGDGSSELVLDDGENSGDEESKKDKP